MSYFYIALGGALGSVLRYILSGYASQTVMFARFPIGTFVVNVLGCLLVGALAGLGEKYQLFSGDSRLFIFTGIMGGFTTFSAFGLETFQLLRRNEWLVATGYVGLSVLVGLLVLSLMFYLTQR